MKINYQHQPVRHSFEIDDDDLRFCRSEDEVRNHIYTRVEYAAAPNVSSFPDPSTYPRFSKLGNTPTSTPRGIPDSLGNSGRLDGRASATIC